MVDLEQSDILGIIGDIQTGSLVSRVSYNLPLLALVKCEIGAILPQNEFVDDQVAIPGENTDQFVVVPNRLKTVNSPNISQKFGFLVATEITVVLDVSNSQFIPIDNDYQAFAVEGASETASFAAVGWKLLDNLDLSCLRIESNESPNLFLREEEEEFPDWLDIQEVSD